MIDGTCLDILHIDKIPSFWSVKKVVQVQDPHFHASRLLILVEVETHLIFDALICPYKIGEKVRALKL